MRRSDVSLGEELLGRALHVDLEKASHRGGPRAYLHTAGVATADSDGRVVSSLVSVFDDFGSSCVCAGARDHAQQPGWWIYYWGQLLPGPGKRPVHTLAPMLLTTPEGVLGLATPGADGQVQTLLQLLVGIQREGLDLARVIARPRWRSENDRLLIEQRHTGIESLRSRGHRVEPIADGDVRFGGCGVWRGYVGDDPVAAADWRRETAAGVA